METLASAIRKKKGCKRYSDYEGRNKTRYAENSRINKNILHTEKLRHKYCKMQGKIQRSLPSYTVAMNY